MNSTRFDDISKLFAERRMSRRQAVASGGAGLVASALGAAGLVSAAAQEATPDASQEPFDEDGSTMFLFLQSFRSGSITEKDGEEDTYTLTLEEGLGQTIYFSDRPERIAGAAPTPQFLNGLGFSPENPPNAALVAEITPGELDISVVELRYPSYDDSTHTATYDVRVLENYEDTMETGFTESPTDLASVAPEFGSAHLFIDDCADDYIECLSPNSSGNRILGQRGYCWNWLALACMPCFEDSYAQECNQTFPDFCQGECVIVT